MKIAINKFFTSMICLLSVSSLLAAPNPPAPYKKPPPPPGLPIDENLYVLIIIAILIGGYVIFKNYIKTKTPI